VEKMVMYKHHLSEFQTRGASSAGIEYVETFENGLLTDINSDNFCGMVPKIGRLATLGVMLKFDEPGGVKSVL
jgi:hypothetical protein